MPFAFLALGSNIQPEKTMLEAITLLSTHMRILEVSTVYLTEPLLRKHQPKYYNCVLKVQTDIEPYKLKFDVLRAIEEKLGRKRTGDKYASRTMDIDIMLYDDLQISRKDLVIPDPEISKRPFLAIPLFELDPRLVLPGENKPIKQIAASFRRPGIIPLKDFTETLRHLIKSLGKQEP
jgi:2-amino-4-hydroxy-6-hydroxymethyldihydropteridine diphosphokinase